MDDVIELVGESPAIVELREEIDRVARGSAKVLLTGESGTGKEVAARLIHMRSSRRARPLVTINSAGIPEALLESELFGHVKGSFTDADRDKRGWLEAADGGTLFIDEVDAISLRIQALFLRFLETGELQGVGRAKAIARPDVRIIAATSRQLPELVKQGTFREDLYYRLNVIHLHLPPLRDRTEDIPLLFAHFWEASRLTRGTHVQPPTFAAGVLEALTHYPWPGNVRELHALVQRLAMWSSGERMLTLDQLPPEIRSGVRPESFEITLSPEFSAKEVKALLTTLANYYRVCGGLGLAMTFEAEHVAAEEPVNA